MAGPSNVIVRNQFVYILDQATLNVFDCLDTVTGQRDIYYIQKGPIHGNVRFPDRQNARNFNQPAPFRAPEPPSSSSSSSDDEPDPPSRSSRPTNTFNSDTYVDIITSSRTVTDVELNKLADKMRFEGEKYTKLVTHLGMKHEDVERIRRENYTRGRSDMICAILKFWKSTCSEPTVGKLGNALEYIGLQKFVTESLEP